ncbi:MAG: hypothetical protein AAF724_05495 [Pseudomonadota bacterium]
MSAWLRDRLSEGDRRVVGAASAVADEVRQNGHLLPVLIELLEDEDTAVVAHAAHALMQISTAEPALFDAHVMRLLGLLADPKQWEIGEQLPKILSRATLTSEQADRLARVLAANVENKSNIVAACSLQGFVDLALDGRIERSMAEQMLDAALGSDRKALAARARQLRKRL